MLSVDGTPFGLRKFELYDIESLWVFRNDTEVAEGLGGFSTGYSRQDLEDWLTYHRGRKDEVLYAIVDRSTDFCVGHVGLYQIDFRSRKAEFAILIGSEDFRGKGYGKRLTHFMVSFGFESLNLHKITLTVLGTNERAAVMYQKLGFVHEGISRQDEWRAGTYVDVVRMSVLESEWNPVLA